MATAAPCYTLLGGFERSASDDAPPSQSSQPADHHAQRTLFWCDGTLHQLLTERSFHDVIMNTDNGVTVKGHKFIMATRSMCVPGPSGRGQRLRACVRVPVCPTLLLCCA